MGLVAERWWVTGGRVDDVSTWTTTLPSIGWYDVMRYDYEMHV